MQCFLNGKQCIFTEEKLCSKFVDMGPSRPRHLLFLTLLKDGILASMTSSSRRKYSGICHSDIHQVSDDWGGSTFPMIPGHEIVGIVSEIGTQVSRYKIGDRAAVGNFVDSCRKCGPSQKGLEQYCIKGAIWTYNGFETQNGKTTPTQGGYSNKIVVDENYVLRIPDNLPLDRSAPLLCAGITLYSPLMHWKAGPRKKVAIIGLGGLGHIGVKIAHALGAEVTVLSHTLKKQEEAKKMGADNFYATSDPDIFKKLKGYFDLLVNTIPVEIDMNRYLKLLAVDGVMVVVFLNIFSSKLNYVVSVNRHVYDLSFQEK